MFYSGQTAAAGIWHALASWKLTSFKHSIAENWYYLPHLMQKWNQSQLSVEQQKLITLVIEGHAYVTQITTH